ncbi:Putative glucose-methanol-choline oxidoreductase, FAD/NAD(P)-binding domain superfamily [Septoria linicola]|uniref:Glucose-methanol-choline oxidoreductase, FAD/NAD(P)-binding domain superfamily n=1 Tax=Septoria linicola TaxID=215465 RepID=A0A9Q9B7K3_9PEZI|nr:Putative glucose-methanol-choline oxidoreductase, FAD/NAD(P)-binding domain superfamily [Septoria linicola]
MLALATATVLGTALAAVWAAPTQQGYDYVIVGGGVTGLVVAHRLTEDETVNVLVIESGESVDNDGTMIPYKANDLTASAGLLWDGITSLPEPGLGNASYNVLVAKVLGGGSVINGMVYDRGSAADYDAWESLGNKGWGWEGVYPYFRKGTTFQPPSAAVAENFNITWDPEAYGNGPLTVSITDTQYDDVKDYWEACRATGVHIPVDGNNGEAYGPSWYANTMDKETGRRAHARYAYIDPIVDRANLKILTGTTAEKIVFENKHHPFQATGVQIVDNASGNFTTVTARKEVVLAAGAIQTPKLLQLSGIGPRSVLEAAGINVKVELDAVGSNFQDHPYATIIFNTSTTTFPTLNSLSTNTTYNASAWAQYQTNKTGPYTYARGNALAFISLPSMTPNTSAVISPLTSQSPHSYLPPLYTTSPRLLAGFLRQKALITTLFSRSDAAVCEFPVPSDGTYALVGVEKPLSRGSVHLNPLDPNGPPDVSYNAFVNPIDRKIMAIGLRFLRKVWSYPPLKKKFSISEIVPGAEYTSDEEIYEALLEQKSLSPTLAHPAGSCPMMPEELGGCVDEKLFVYGTERLSVVDVSIVPMIPSQHLQATAYMIGEKAADLIKARA